MNDVRQYFYHAMIWEFVAAVTSLCMEKLNENARRKITITRQDQIFRKTKTAFFSAMFKNTTGDGK